MTYDESCEAKVANFDIVVGVDEHVVTLDVTMNDAKIVHVKIYAGTVEDNLHAQRHRHLNVSLHVERREQAVVDQFVNDHDVGDRRTAAHEQGNVWVPQNALHDNFVLNLRQQLICDIRVKDFLNCHRSAVQRAFMNDRKASLANLLSDLDVSHCDLPYAWDGRQTP